MPYLEDAPSQDTAVERQRRRWAITGKPEIGKTTSLLTFPRPCAIVSCPDELGFGSIPKHTHVAPGSLCTSACPRWQLDVFIFGAVNAERPDWIGTCEETRRLMADLLTGKKGWKAPVQRPVEGSPLIQPDVAVGADVGTQEKTRSPVAQVHLTGPRESASPRRVEAAGGLVGPARSGQEPAKEQREEGIRYRTVALDGWHKLYPVYLNMFTGGALARGEEFDGRRIYGRNNAVFFGDARKWCQSDVEWLVFTMWVDRDTDDPNTPNATSHFFPSLSGKAGQTVVGEIGITVAAERQGTGPAAKYIWLTQPDSRYWGVGCHLPPDLAKQLPPFVLQEWKALVPYLGLDKT